MMMEDKSLPQHFMYKICELYEQNDLCDVTLIATPGGESAETGINSIHIHSVILAAHSPVFRTLFNKKRAGRNRWCLSVRAENMRHWRVLARFMYTGNIDLSTDSVDALYRLAGAYGMDRVKTLCETFRKSHRDVTNINCVNSTKEEYVSLNEVYETETGNAMVEMSFVKQEESDQDDGNSACQEESCDFEVEALYTEVSDRLPDSSSVEGQGQSASSEGHTTAGEAPGQVGRADMTTTGGVSASDSSAPVKLFKSAKDLTSWPVLDHSGAGDVSLMMEVEKEEDMFDNATDVDDVDTSLTPESKCPIREDMFDNATDIHSVDTSLTPEAKYPINEPASAQPVSDIVSSSVGSHISMVSANTPSVSKSQTRRKRGRPKKVICRRDFTATENGVLQHEQKEHNISVSQSEQTVHFHGPVTSLKNPSSESGVDALSNMGVGTMETELEACTVISEESSAKADMTSKTKDTPVASSSHSASEAEDTPVMSLYHSASEVKDSTMTSSTYSGTRANDNLMSAFDSSSKTEDPTLVTSSAGQSPSDNTSPVFTGLLDISADPPTATPIASGGVLPDITPTHVSTVSHDPSVTFTFSHNSASVVKFPLHTSTKEDIGHVGETAGVPGVSQPAENLNTCLLCAKTFARKDSLLRHQKMHNGGTFDCSLCGSKYITKYSLEDHIAVKHMGNSYPCLKCDKLFGTKGGLTNHLKIHDEHFKHVCPHCAKGFVYKSDYLAHIAKHTGEKPHSCMWCKKTFAFTSTLSRHRQTCGKPVEPHICHICGTTLKNKFTFQEHLKKHDNSIKPQCDHCGKIFNCRSSLSKHKQRVQNKRDSV